MMRLDCHWCHERVHVGDVPCSLGEDCPLGRREGFARAYEREMTKRYVGTASELPGVGRGGLAPAPSTQRKRHAGLSAELLRAADKLQQERRYSGRGEPYASLMRRAAAALGDAR